MEEGNGWPDFHFPYVPLKAEWRVYSRETKARREVRKLLYIFHAKDDEILLRWKWSRNMSVRQSWPRLLTKRESIRGRGMTQHNF